MSAFWAEVWQVVLISLGVFVGLLAVTILFHWLAGVVVFSDRGRASKPTTVRLMEPS